MGQTQYTVGTANVRASCILLLATGNVGHPGSGANIFRGHEGKLPLCAEMCSTKSLLAGDGEIIAEIYKERARTRGYGSGAWGWQTAYREDIAV